MNSKIFITGASGFAGRQIVKSGVEKGYSFRCLLRNPVKSKHLLNYPQCELVKGDITDKDSLQKNIESCSSVIHLVGIITKTKKAGFDEIHFEGTKNVVDAAKKTGIEKFVHMSALGARKDAKSAYHISKWKAEEYVRNSGLNFTVLKPSVIFGRDDSFINLFLKITKLSPVIPVLGNGSLEPVWVGDVAEAFLVSLLNNKAGPKTIELGGGEIYRHNELVKLICRVFKRRRIVFTLPQPLARLAAFTSEILIPNSLLTKDQLNMLNEENIVTGIRPEKIFDFKFKSLKAYLEEMMQETYTR